jgi:putative endonuclease
LARLLGSRGERVALRELRRRGYRILARNLRTPAGEVDALAEHAGRLVLVEVKASARAAAPAPLERVGAEQRRRLEGAGRWLTSCGSLKGRGFRVDLVAVTFAASGPVVTIRPDAL